MSARAMRAVTRAAAAAVFFASLLGGAASVAQGLRPVDLELVLAVDTSSSVSPSEFNLQMQGLANAFRNPDVQGAIQAAGDLGIAVAMVQWSDNRKQTVAIDWQMIQDGPSAEAFAREIDNTPRFLIGGGTAIGGAVNFSAHQLRINSYEGRRKVIDVSGDGRTNQGSNPARARDDAVAQGITINGLAILNEDQLVDRHYLANVIGGTGSFVMQADDYSDFARAIVDKLVKEIAGVPIAALPAARAPVQQAARAE
jgi:Protein of unknown function (DUF1194)